MSKIKKIVFLISMFGAVGIMYTILILKNIPETFDFNLEEEFDEFETSV
jgi:hypothetical protein